MLPTILLRNTTGPEKVDYLRFELYRWKKHNWITSSLEKENFEKYKMFCVPVLLILYINYINKYNCRV